MGLGFSTNSHNQCARILDYLSNNQHGATTLEMVGNLDALRPGARVCELRQAGHNIVTHWTNQDTPLGNHRIARYVLLN
ncbi:MAG: helix-turn-helix domain-containing protein [Methylovulum sp.]|nr:helix-turn-helix domain-containing protein [Methylovulum sp.]